MVSQGYKDLLTGGLWASSDVADRELPEEVGLTRADGWTVAYEQQGSGSEPERTIFNQLLYELWSVGFDIADYGVPTWDDEVDYTPATRRGVLCDHANGPMGNNGFHWACYGQCD